HPEANRPGLLRGGAVPRHSRARSQSPGEGAAGGPGIVGRGARGSSREAGERAACHARQGRVMNQGAVLIVDDDPDLLTALPEALRIRMSGLTVETVDSAAAALDRIAQRDYDAIVTDIKMPGMDGLELLARIKNDRPDTPTLMITGLGEADLVVEALRGGACDFMQKPLDREYFVASLRRAMQMRELSRRAEEEQLALERHISELESRVEDRAQRL